MRELDVNVITDTIADICAEINYSLSDDMEKAINDAECCETESVGKDVLSMMKENLKVAREENIPICQDTGLCVVFMEIGQDVHFYGGSLYGAINGGVRRGYINGYLRKSVVSDPIIRVNTGDNTPAVIHTDIVSGDSVKLTVTSKGFGSENTSKLFMLKPADGIEGVKEAVINTVLQAGANACPPMVIGVGVGGNFEKCAIMAKHALTRDIGCNSEIPYIAQTEKELLEAINRSGIGPAGLGGKTTALAVNIETHPTHIAGLPVAVNICCHVNRHKTVIL